MAKFSGPSIVSANDLFDGDVVYLDRNGGWTRDLRLADVAEAEDTAASLLERAHQPASVVGPYLVAVRIENAVPVPLHLREKLRHRGPSNRPDVGRQADAAAHAFSSLSLGDA